MLKIGDERIHCFRNLVCQAEILVAVRIDAATNFCVVSIESGLLLLQIIAQLLQGTALIKLLPRNRLRANPQRIPLEHFLGRGAHACRLHRVEVADHGRVGVVYRFREAASGRQLLLDVCPHRLGRRPECFIALLLTQHALNLGLQFLGVVAL